MRVANISHHLMAVVGRARNELCSAWCHWDIQHCSSRWKSCLQSAGVLCLQLYLSVSEAQWC